MIEEAIIDPKSNKSHRIKVEISKQIRHLMRPEIAELYR
jgi:hypothetical protein